MIKTNFLIATVYSVHLISIVMDSILEITPAEEANCFILPRKQPKLKMDTEITILASPSGLPPVVVLENQENVEVIEMLPHGTNLGGFGTLTSTLKTFNLTKMRQRQKKRTQMKVEKMRKELRERRLAGQIPIRC